MSDSLCAALPEPSQHSQQPTEKPFATKRRRSPSLPGKGTTEEGPKNSSSTVEVPFTFGVKLGFMFVVNNSDALDDKKCWYLYLGNDWTESDGVSDIDSDDDEEERQREKSARMWTISLTHQPRTELRACQS